MVCLLQLASVVSATEPAVVRLAVSEGRDIRFAHLTSKDGLSFGQIRDIVQDDQGFLWFNTSNVLNRYDGYEFKFYRRDAAHPNYPAAGFLHFIFKDHSGFLWVSSNESLDRFDPATETTTRFPIDSNTPKSVLGPVRHISQDRAGTLWLATDNGVHRLDPATGAFRHYSHNPMDAASLSSSVVRSTYEDREGTLWVCTVAGLDAFDRQTEKVTDRIRLNVPESLVIKALEDHAGKLWIIYLSGNGVASWDRHTRRLTLYSFENGEPPGTALSGAQGIHEDADGNLWLATRSSRGSGLLKIDENRKKAVRYRHSPVDPDSLSDDMLMSVFEDREGSIWVGTATTGVDRFQRRPLPFQRYRNEPGNPQSLLRTSVTSVYADSHENIWVGSALGLTRIDGKTGGYSFLRQAGSGPASLSNAFVISIVEDHSGFLWFGTYGGLNRYDPRTGRFTAFRHNAADSQSLSHDAVFSLLVDHRGMLWAGTGDGLSRLEDPATGRFRCWKADPAGTSLQEVSSMIEDPNGVLWLVSGTLQRFDPASGRFTAYKLDHPGTGIAERESSSALVRSGKRIENSSLLVDHSGALWVATPNGLVRFDREHEKFTTYDERDGLPGSSIHGILEDHNGNLWVSTLGGLSRFNPRTKNFTNYHDTDGLAGNAFEGYPAVCRSRRGQMFFGSKSGLTSFWPEQIVEKPSIPPVMLTEFSLRNRLEAPGPGRVLAKSINFTQSLTLSHQQNMFSFEFAALSYFDPARNQYRYMLEPLDHSWNTAAADHRVATFTTLPTGKYTLRIQGSNNRGVWNEQGVALQLEILPPWWGTRWFQAVCLFSFVALLWGAYYTRVRRMEREFASRIEERVEERTRIARELHDTLLQSFQASLIQMQAARNILDRRPENAVQSLEKAIRTAADAVAEGRSAIQDLRVQPAVRGDLAQLLTTAGQEFAHAENAPENPAAFRVTVEGERQDLKPLLQDEVYRIARELLRNAFRHAQAGRIEAEIRYETRQFRLHVRDDGKGIDPEILKTGVRAGHYGLPGMRERANRFGGTLEFWSEAGAGTEAVLSVPAAIAYGASNGGPFSFLRRKKTGA